jgi:hypothetical protein
MATINQPQKRESDLDVVMKGLQIINGFMDIKKTMDYGDELKLKQAEAEQVGKLREMQLKQGQAELDKGDRLGRGEFLPGEIIEQQAAGKFMPAVGGKGDINVMEARGQGQIGPAATPRTFTSPGAFKQYDDQRALALQQQKSTQEQAEKSTKDKQEINRITSDRRKEFIARIEDTDGPIRNLRNVRKAADVYSKDSIGISDDIAVINVYSRLLSPGIVTDTDFNNAAKAGGLPQQAQAFYDTLTGQGRLTDEQRSELLQTIQSIGSGFSDEFNKTANAYRAQAVKEGLDPEDVVTSDRAEFVADIDGRFTAAYKKILGSKKEQKTERTVMQKIGDAIMPTAKADKQKDVFSNIIGE